MNALNRQLQEELRTAVAQLAAGRCHPGGGDLRRAEGVCRRSGCQRVRRDEPCRHGARRGAAEYLLGRGGEAAQARSRRGHRIRARRRVRTGPRRRLPGQRRRCALGSTRGTAGNHPRLRRNATATAVDRAREGQGSHIYRAIRPGRRSPRDRASSMWWSRRPRFMPPRSNWRRSSPPVPHWLCGRPRPPSTAGWMPTWRADSASNPTCSPRCSPRPIALLG